MEHETLSFNRNRDEFFSAFLKRFTTLNKDKVTKVSLPSLLLPELIIMWNCYQFVVAKCYLEPHDISVSTGIIKPPEIRNKILLWQNDLKRILKFEAVFNRGLEAVHDCSSSAALLSVIVPGGSHGKLWTGLVETTINYGKKGGVCLFLSSYWLLLTFSFLDTEYFDWSRHLVKMLSCQIASFIHWWYMIYPLIYQLIINDNKWYKFDSWIEKLQINHSFH